jgi:hypothetical protein
MQKRKLDLDTGQFVFLSYARADKDLIFRMGIVQRLAKAGFLVRIDNGETWGWDDEVRPFVSPFAYGDAWETQILEGAARALCVLALCSGNTRQRLTKNGEEAWIAKELKAGRENGTLFAVSIHDQVNPTSQAEQDFWQTHLGGDFARLQTGNLGVLLRNDTATGTQSLPQALDLLVGAVDLKIRQALDRPRLAPTLEATQVHRLLNCLDRVQPAGCVAQNAGLHLAETDPRSEHLGFAARLALVDLPDEELCLRDETRRHIDSAKRHHELVGGTAPLAARWVEYDLPWPQDPNLPPEQTALSIVQAIARRLSATEGILRLSLDDLAAAIGTYLNTRSTNEKAGYLFWLICPDESAGARRAADVIRYLSKALAGMKSDWFRLVLFLHEAPSARGFSILNWMAPKRAVGRIIREEDGSAPTIMSLGNVTVADLSDWRHLAAHFVAREASMIADDLRGLYQNELDPRHHASVDLAALPMQTVRSIVKPALAAWPARQPQRRGA